MDNGKSFLDVIDDDIFGQNAASEMFNWADEFLGDNEMDISGTDAMESGNLATTNTPSNILLTSSNYAATSSIPAQTVSLATPYLQNSSMTVLEQQATVMPTFIGQTIVNPLQNISGQSGLNTPVVQQGNQQYILKTANGNQIQLTHSQLQQHLLQQQQNSAQPIQQVTSPSVATSSISMLNRSITPNAGGLPTVSFGLNPSQFKSSSPGPNVNIVHLPGNIQAQTQQPQPTQQFQIAPGTFLQIPGGTQSLGNTSIVQGQPTILTGQQGTLMNTQNTVIQNPNVVNVNVATHQAVLCNSSGQQQHQQQQRLTNLQAPTQNPFNIQGTLIQTAEGKSILIPSQNLAQPINIQQLSMAQPQAQTHNTVGNMIHLGSDNSQNQGVPQIVLNSQGQQILVQRANTPGGQSQNIIVRTTLGQQGLVQIQQRPAQTLQANTGSNQQLKIVQQATQSQTGVPMINIGGQNISLQQLSGQLGNLQGLQVIQQQQQQQNQQQNTLNSQGQITSQGQIIQPGQITLQQLQQLQNSQGQVTVQQHQTVLNTASSQSSQQNRSTTPIQTSQGQMTFQRGQVSMQQQNLSGTTMQSLNNVSMHQQNQTNTQVQIGSNKPTRVVQASQMSTESAKNAQAQILLQQIKRSLKMNNNPGDFTSSSESPPNVNLTFLKQENMDKMQLSQSKMAGSNDPLPNFVKATPPPPPNVNLMVVKQENMDKMQFSCATSSSNFPFQASAIKKEPDLIESLVKQEVSCAVVTTADFSNVTSTMSQSTPMSLFMLGNNEPVVSSSKLPVSSPSITFNENSVTNISSSSDLQNSAGSVVNSSVGQGRQSATVQTIHLPPELQHQFQRVQLEMKNVQAATNTTPEQKQLKLRQLQVFQRKILLKGRVLATTKAEPHHIKQGLAALSQTGLGLNSSNLTQNSSSPALFSNAIPQNSAMLSTNSSSQIPSSTTVKDLLKSMAASDQSMTPSSTRQQLTGMMPLSNTHQQLTGMTPSPNTPHQLTGNTNSMGPGGLSFMNSSTSSSQALSALLGTSSSSLSTPSVTQAHQISATSMTSNVNLVEKAPTPPLLIQTAMGVGQSNVPSSSNISSATPEAAVPTQIKIANKVLTLSLTKAQRDKVQSYLDRMTPEQQQQYLQTQQGVLQRIQRQQDINAQVRAQLLAHKKTQQVNQSKVLSSIQSQVAGVTTTATATNLDSSIIKSEVKTIPVPNTSVQVTKADMSRKILKGQKRSYMDIPKGTLINQQIKQDQNHASNPDTKRPFKSRGDACRRLLRYHVFQSYGPTPEDFDKFEGTMSDIATELLQKKDKMLDRFRILLLHETMRCEPSSELVMLQRMQNQDLRKVIEEEKELVKKDPDAFVPMPSKFLKKEKVETDTKSENDDVEEEESSDMEDMNSTLVKSEPTDSEEDKKKVKKLVIKTDGENYRSSFKRHSLDSSRSSLEGTESQDVSMCADKTSDQTGTISNIDDEDEDTNEFGDDRFQSLQDKGEQAALLISSAEDESQDSQMEEMESNYGGMHATNSSHITNSVAKSFGVIRSNSNCELTSESVYYDESPPVTMNSSRPSVGSYSSLSRVSSLEETGKYVPNHSPVSNASSDNDVIIEESHIPEKMGHFDKFNMYQPITESLTDSEENSHYSADNSAEQNSIVIDDDEVNLIKNSWKTMSRGKGVPEQEVSSSDQESDQEVKAQMESAINSILSLGQSDHTQTMFGYSQSNDLLGNASQQSLLDYNSPGDFQVDLNEMSQDSIQSLSEVNPFAVENEGNNDLDSAVNSILM